MTHTVSAAALQPGTLLRDYIGGVLYPVEVEAVFPHGRKVSVRFSNGTGHTYDAVDSLDVVDESELEEL